MHEQWRPPEGRKHGDHGRVGGCMHARPLHMRCGMTPPATRRGLLPPAAPAFVRVRSPSGSIALKVTSASAERGSFLQATASVAIGTTASCGACECCSRGLVPPCAGALRCVASVCARRGMGRHRAPTSASCLPTPAHACCMQPMYACTRLHAKHPQAARHRQQQPGPHRPRPPPHRHPPGR